MRSKLFVPASRPDLLAKALSTEADAICLDLEDAVLPEGRATARLALQQFFLAQPTLGNKRLLLRSNALGTSDFESDLALALLLPIVALVLPKVECAADVARAADALRAAPRTIGLLPTLESAHGLSNAAAIAAASPRVLGLQLGFADLLESLGIAQDHVFARQQIRLQVRLAAAQAHVPCYDSAYADFTEEAGYRAQLASARSLGFAGASCIHPRQVPIANEIFSPTAEEIHTARQIVAAAAHAATHGLAVFALDGRMIDKPFLDRAKAILAEAEQQ